MIFDKEFKLAISDLPSKEKDKLLLRLLKKDLKLANRLYFELVNTESVEARRESLEEHIRKEALLRTNRYYSPGILMMEMRDLSGEINEHVSITKDKYGEVSLNLLMLNEILKLNLSNINKANPHRSYTLGIYIIARVFKILMLIDSLHEDLRIEFETGLDTLRENIGGSDYLMRMAIQNGLDVNWISAEHIPENIKEIHKDIRAQGFLK